VVAGIAWTTTQNVEKELKQEILQLAGINLQTKYKMYPGRNKSVPQQPIWISLATTASSARIQAIRPSTW